MDDNKNETGVFILDFLKEFFNQMLSMIFGKTFTLFFINKQK